MVEILIEQKIKEFFKDDPATILFYSKYIPEISALKNYDESVFEFINANKLNTKILKFLDYYFGKQIDFGILVNGMSKYKKIKKDYLESRVSNLTYSPKALYYAQKYKDKLPEYLYEEMTKNILETEPLEWLQEYIDGSYSIKDRILHYMPDNIFQYFYKSQKNDIYILYRGLTLQTRVNARDWYNDEISGNDLVTQTITSWSTDKNVARAFAIGNYSVVLSIIISKKHVLLDIEKISEIIDSLESEVLVLPGRYRCTIEQGFETVAADID